MAEHRTRDVAGILHFLTPQQMAEEIVRLDAVIAGEAPNIRMGRLPARVAACRAEQRAPSEWVCDCAQPGPGCKPTGWRAPGLGEAAAPRPFTGALNDIPATLTHDEGAYAQCGECARYTLNPNALTDRPPPCDCGSKHGWCGSFKKPGPDAKWSGKAPAGVAVRRGSQIGAAAIPDAAAATGAQVPDAEGKTAADSRCSGGDFKKATLGVSPSDDQTFSQHTPTGGK